MRHRTLCLAIGRIDIGGRRWIAPAPWPVVAGIGPELAGLGTTAPRIEHRRRGLVSEQSRRTLQPLERMVPKRRQPSGSPSDPVGERRAVELDVLTSEDLRLPIERQVIGILGDNDVRDERGGGHAAGDDTRHRGRLDDNALAGPAAIARTTGDQHPQGRRHDVEALGSILADGMKRAAAAAAGLIVYIDDLLDALEMRRQRARLALRGLAAVPDNARALIPALTRDSAAPSSSSTSSN